jgi:ribulose-phosphate 3-epimerase
LTGIVEVLADLDLLLVMTVNPGFGGQEFIPNSIDKIRRARRILADAGNRAVLEVDGGIARDTIGECWRAGADTFVAGNAIFSAKNPLGEIAALRDQCAVSV